MRGDFTRGIQRLPAVLRQVEGGWLNTRLDLHIEQLTAVSARVAAPYRQWPDQVGQAAAALAVDLAQQHGIGLVAFPKPNVVGAVLEPTIRAGMLGLAVVQNAPLLNYPGIARRNLVGNNPIAFCAPGDPPFVFDGALSQFSLSGLRDVAQRGRLPVGAVLDAEGHPSDDPRIVESLVQGDSGQGSLAPLGSIKGLGLAMCAEFLAGAHGRLSCAAARQAVG